MRKLSKKAERLIIDYSSAAADLTNKAIRPNFIQFREAWAALLDYIAELEAEQRWRIVADGELPKNNDYYWAHDDLGQQGMILFYDGEWNKFTNLSYITHWMPLPEPPEVK